MKNNTGKNISDNIRNKKGYAKFIRSLNIVDGQLLRKTTEAEMDAIDGMLKELPAMNKLRQIEPLALMSARFGFYSQDHTYKELNAMFGYQKVRDYVERIFWMFRTKRELCLGIKGIFDPSLGASNSLVERNDQLEAENLQLKAEIRRLKKELGSKLKLLHAMVEDVINEMKFE